jgi:hypothetical protein
MSTRRLLRIALALVALFFLWTRTSKELHDGAGLWLVFEVSGIQQKWKRMRDEVPKKPLGLDT